MSEDLQEQIENAPSHDENAESSPAQEATVETTEASEAESTEAPKKSNGVQDRINQLTREKYEARQEKAELEARLKALEESKPEVKTPELVAPNEDDYDDYQSYQSANAAFIAKTAEDAAYARIKAERQEDSKASEQSQRQEALKAKKVAFDENLSAKKENFQDFEEVAYGHTFMDTDLAEQIFEMDKGPEVAYHLGSHLDEAERIFSLDPVKRARELTKLEFRVDALKPKVVSDAPDPISPLGQAEKVGQSQEDMSDDAWLDWRYKQLNERK